MQRLGDLVRARKNCEQEEGFVLSCQKACVGDRGNALIRPDGGGFERALDDAFGI